MRIIAGEMRGRILKTVAGIQTRPTSDKVKGAIFNVLGDRVKDARILDLFTGTGNLALEALSRGAREAVLVEKGHSAFKVVRENIRRLGLEHKAKVVLMDAFKFLDNYHDEVFNLIFLDPPYHQELVSKSLTILSERLFLGPNGVIIAETAKDDQLNAAMFSLEIRKVSLYGDTKVWYLQSMDV
ncbi:16S rRNA (guanine(966)-N(2))-methyltransferase RsmD [Desulfosporosinus sp. PR]|uniref:16S rRNA (guanine(966)-N(2))-methyltransferase RsmD n=1 Tax=Candidatus Desulfosporosinus nitrosoreducens TaxID=3401928 RepID=UPI0027F1847E|nr:16S rRNA (guanine(966)-N(2))-methyltransferase RsmD [Desulfosporosinus sp. PR]MDQ7094744.1 16S rRNA (guanine(966)-N(2))-methyltransferase RsmD [Desulfosporosinus sp. PR]